MRSTFWVLVVAACGGSSGAIQDGKTATDSSPGVDALTDATPCAADQDGDGICDDVDDCPTVFDPGQVDLDHDHLGFACDPTESFSFDAPGWNGFVDGAFASDDAFALTLEGTPATYAAAEPRGSIVATSDDPATPWVATLPITFETASSRLVLAPNTFDDHPAGELDIAAKALVAPFAARAAEGVGFPIATIRPDPVAAIPLQSATDGDLYVQMPGAGLASVSHVVGGWDTLFIGPQTVPGTHTLLLPSNTKAPFLLQSFTAGDAAPTDVASGTDDLKYLGVSAGTVLYCARTGTVVSIIAANATGISTLAVPFTSCPFQETPIVAGTDLILQDEDVGVLLRDGAAITLFTGISGVAITHVQRTPTELVLTLFSDKVNQAIVVDADASVHFVGSGLTSVSTSANGSTVHVAGADANATNHVQLVRHRPGVADQQIQLPAFFSISGLTTTPEGAALAELSPFGVVPSGSMTLMFPTTKNARNTTVTRDRAVVTLEQGGLDALFQYSEVGGAPVLTQVTTPTFPFDTLPAGTTYFTLERSDFELARIDVVGGVPTLTTIVTDQPAGFLGLDRSGAELWLDPRVFRLYRGTPTELVEIARGTSLTPIIDTLEPLRPIVGWFGEDAMGGFVCMADAPDRCWTIPTGFHPTATTAIRGATVDDDRIRMVGISSAGTQVTVTVFHNVGAPDRPQPLL